MSVTLSLAFVFRILFIYLLKLDMSQYVDFIFIGSLVCLFRSIVLDLFEFIFPVKYCMDHYEWRAHRAQRRMAAEVLGREDNSRHRRNSTRSGLRSSVDQSHRNRSRSTNVGNTRGGRHNLTTSSNMDPLQRGRHHRRVNTAPSPTNLPIPVATDDNIVPVRRSHSLSPPRVNYDTKPSLLNGFNDDSGTLSSNTQRYIPYRRGVLNASPSNILGSQRYTPYMSGGLNASGSGRHAISNGPIYELNANRSTNELDGVPVQHAELQGRAILGLGDLSSSNALRNLDSDRRARLLAAFPDIGASESLTDLDVNLRRRCMDFIIEDSISDPRNHNTELIVNNNEDVTLGFRSNNNRLHDVYIKIKHKTKRQFLWNIWERHRDNFGTYSEFKQSWDANTSVWEHIKSNFSANVKRGVGDIIGVEDIRRDIKSSTREEVEDLRQNLRRDIERDVRSNVREEVEKLLEARRPFDTGRNG